MKPLILAAMLTGCATGNDSRAPRIASIAELREPGGRSVGTARLLDRANDIYIRIEASGLAPGLYGAHVHMTGRCDPPSFDSAGGHWNPTARQHGTRNPQGYHLGDLPNLEVGADGTGRIEIHIPDATVESGSAAIHDADGAAVVIHAGPDDYRTDPSGNSGARIACGVLR